MLKYWYLEGVKLNTAHIWKLNWVSYKMLVFSPHHVFQDTDLLSPGIVINSISPSSPTLEGSRHLSRSNIDIPRSSGPDDPKRQLPRKRSDSSTYELDTIKHHQAFLSRWIVETRCQTVPSEQLLVDLILLVSMCAVFVYVLTQRPLLCLLVVLILHVNSECFVCDQSPLQRSPRGAGVTTIKQQHHAGRRLLGKVWLWGDRLLPVWLSSRAGARTEEDCCALIRWWGSFICEPFYLGLL